MAFRKPSKANSGLTDIEYEFVSRHTAGVNYTQAQEFAIRRFAYEHPRRSVESFVKYIERNYADFGLQDPVDSVEQWNADIYRDVHDHPESLEEIEGAVLEFIKDNLETPGEDLRQYIRDNYLDFGMDDPDELTESEFWKLWREAYENQ